MATDLAEVVGGAIALYLLFDLPLLVGGVITGVVSLLLLAVQNRRGQRIFERVITGLLLVIAIGFLTSLFVEPPPLGDVGRGSGAALRRAPRASCWPPRCSARRSCRTPSTCTPGWPATGTAIPRPVRAPLAAARHPMGRRPGDAGRRRGEPGDAAGRGDQPAGPGEHRLHRGRVRRGAGHARADGRIVVRHRTAGVRAGVDVGRRLRGRDDHAGPAAPVVSRCCCAGWSR